MADTEKSTSSIGLVSILTIVFVIFKLLGKIAWSWWWVFSPLWISFGLFFALLGVLAIGAILIAVIQKGSE